MHDIGLRDRAQAAGTRGILIDLPPGIPIDRIGALDGVHTYPINTPFEFRSLAPSTLRPENDVHKVLTTTDIRVGATITAPGSAAPAAAFATPSCSPASACATGSPPAPSSAS